MKSQSNTGVLSFLRFFVRTASIIVSGASLVVMFGWILNRATLMSILPGLPIIRFNTALCLLLMAASVWLLHSEGESLAGKRIGKALAVVVLLVSLITLTEYLFGLDLGIDQLLVKDPYSPRGLFPGRMSPIAVLCSGLGSTALLLIGSRISQYFSLSVFILSLIGIMGFLFDFQAFFRIPQNTYSAIQTSWAFLLLSLALLAAQPSKGMMKIVSSNLPGSRALRLLLPGIVIFTLIMGWLVEWAESTGVFDTNRESIFLVLVLIFVYSPLVYYIAKNINQSEERILYANRLYATLSQVNQTIVRVDNQKDLFENICRVAVDYGEFRLAWIGLINGETGHVYPASVHGYRQNQLSFQQISIKDAPFEQGLIGLALQSGLAQFSDDIQDDPRMAHWHDTAIKDGYHSAAAIPFRHVGEVIGLLNLYSADIGFFKVKEEQSLLEEMGSDISFALDSMESETRRKRAEEQIRYQASLIENISDAVIAVDEKQVITSWNRAAQKLYGWEAAEVLGKQVQEVTRSELTESQKADAIKALNETGRFQVEVLHYHRNGKPIWVEGGTIALHDGVGNLNGFVSINRDITQRKQSEEILQRQNQRLKILREIDTAILTAASLETIVGAALSHIRELIDCRRASMSLFDWGTNEALIFNVSMTGETSIPEGTRMPLALFQDMIQTLAKNQLVLINDLNALADPPPQIQSHIRNGLHSMCLLPLFSQNRLIGSFSLFSEARGFFDEEKITLGREVANQIAIAISQKELIEDLRILNAELEQRIAERTADLRRTNVELEHANRAKSDFLATMSHELRTPLNSVLGLSESLLEQRRGPLNDHQQKSLQTVAASGQHLLNLINDILEISKIEAGRLSVHPDTISVKEVCESSLNFVRELAFRKSVSLEYQVDPSVPTVYADPQRLKQILVNLLNNAVKFTPENESVRLEVHLNSERDQIHFSVIDSGIGIAPADLKKLFTPFTQLDSSLAREYEGTGLGLVLVYKMTELHGGSVQVESEVGKGSRFTIVLPWSEGEPTGQFTGIDLSASFEAVQKRTSAAENQAVILLADDNEPNILVIDDYLQEHGYQVVIAHNGLEALKRAEAISPDLILMDIQMPEMDGLEAIHRLRLQPRFSSTPIIALTALAMAGDREECLRAGATDYMAKPVSLKMLLETIEKLLEPGDGISAQSRFAGKR